MVFPLIFHLAMEVKSFGVSICLLWLLSQNAEAIKYVLMSVKWIFQVVLYEGMKQLLRQPCAQGFFTKCAYFLFVCKIVCTFADV